MNQSNIQPVNTIGIWKLEMEKELELYSDYLTITLLAIKIFAS